MTEQIETGVVSQPAETNLAVEEFHRTAQALLDQLGQVIVGQQALIHDLLVTLLAGGHAILEGVPGLGKTLLVRTLSECIECDFGRIQFTPDLMPADIVGTTIITEEEGGRRGFRFEAGPIFTNLLLADEINRAAPRTQSALLEAMQEGRATVAGVTRSLPRPFFVLATQNPIEMEGTYPLPEAQLDRFLYKLHVPYPSRAELIQIAERTTGRVIPAGAQVATGETILAMQALAREVLVGSRILEYAADLIGATHPEEQTAPDGIRQHLRVGASPRGMQALIWGAKVEALLDDRKAVAIDDLRRVIYPALRHRLILNFEAMAEGVSPDEILAELVDAVPVPK